MWRVLGGKKRQNSKVYPDVREHQPCDTSDSEMNSKDTKWVEHFSIETVDLADHAMLELASTIRHENGIP